MNITDTSGCWARDADAFNSQMVMPRMNLLPELRAQVDPFLAAYDCARYDQIWRAQSERFRNFWTTRVMAPDSDPISDADCDQIISILDRSGKGNKKGSEAVARAMVPQGAWRRLLNEFHVNKALGQLVNLALVGATDVAKARAIDDVYAFNEGKRNNLTGPSGNTINALLAAFDPERNLSIISVKDRRAILQALDTMTPFEWESASMGTRIAMTNDLVIAAARHIHLTGSARTVSRFFYAEAVQPLWRSEHTVKLPGGYMNVTVPTVATEEEGERPEPAIVDDELRESMKIQALLCELGTAMGFKIWLPRGDRSRVLKAWQAKPGQLLDSLLLGFEPVTTATVEQIDVLWMKGTAIVRAFEVEGTTSIYSGLLRMADLVALQPNLKVKLHIVASVERREKVMKELTRPVFSLLQAGPLKKMCTYLSYDSVIQLKSLPYLEYTSEGVISEYEESADDDSEAP